AGFAAARGAVIASTDADTVVPPFWVERIMEHFRADPVLGAVYGPVYWPDGQRMEQLLVRYPITWGLWASNRLRRSLWWGSNFAVRREIFWEAGGFPVQWGAGSGEDTELARRVRRVAPVRFDPGLVVYASSRRVREGWANVGKRMAVSIVNRSVLRQSPLPFPDIR
ncbi:MAG TPA: glycosyltransferase, partial [Chloroflexi bacterium]|nr:glycosyltransferase [Chloroflexota bacterium]